MSFEYKLSLRCNIQKAFGLETNEFVLKKMNFFCKQMNLFCKMIIGCNLEMMDFITHGPRNCVLGVGKDSGMMGVDKDSRHGTLLSLISFHGMTCRIS